MSNTLFTDLDTILNSNYDYDIEVIKSVYQHIIDTKLNASGMRYFYEHMGLIGTSVDTDDESSVEEFSIYYRKYNDMINGIISHLVNLNTDEDSFYQKLWELIEEGILVDNNLIDRLYAWLFVWRNDFIPYFHMENGLKLSDKDFNDTRENLFIKISKANFILQAEFSQKTERCSLLIDILDSCDNSKEKAVLLSQIISISSNFSDINHIKRILRKIGLPEA